MHRRLLILTIGLGVLAAVTISTWLTKIETARELQLVDRAFLFEQQRDLATEQRDECLLLLQAQQKELNGLREYYRKHSPKLAGTGSL